MDDVAQGTHEVVDEYTLQQRTAAGWKLVQVIQTSEPISYQVSPQDYGGPHNNYVQTPEKRAQMVGLVTKYLIARTADDEMSFLRDRIEELSADLRSATETVKAHEKSADFLAKENERLRQEQERSNERYVRDTKALREEADLCRDSSTKSREETARIKSQLTKLTKAFGELQIQQVLGAEPGYTEAR